MTGPTDRAGRLLGIITREAAQFISREASSDPLITVVRATAAAHGERVLVFVSVFPEERALSALAFLDRRREAFSDHLKTHARIRPLPRVDFLLDNHEMTGAPVAEVSES